MSTVGTSAWWLNHLAERTRRARATKDDLYVLLTHYPAVARIEVDYDGSGDSGSTEAVRYFGDTGDDPIDFVEAAAPDPTEAVEDYVYAALPGGWEINEGSYGTCTIDVRRHTAHFDHHGRVATDDDDDAEPDNVAVPFDD